MNHPRRLTSISDVAEQHLCLGCGTCAFMQPDAIQMVDVFDQGRRPLVLVGDDGRRPDTRRALAACPGAILEQQSSADDDAIPELRQAWGPVLEVWEGYATDADIRLAASSGGIATALSLFAIERHGMHGVLHTAARSDVPYLNHTVMSTSREQLLSAAGSRYAPASPCDGLDRIETAPRPSVFIGKPCDVAGAARARELRPHLDEKLGLTIALFCAGTPSTKGTVEMLERMGVDDLSRVADVRYRGNGWPGAARVVMDGPSGPTRELSYEESWGEVLQKHTQWRCRLCPDHTGEFADIAVGDPWYREIEEGDPGRSLVLVRTERGRRILRAAMEAGVVFLEPAAPTVLPASQPNLLRVRGSVWARLWTSRLFGLPVPVYRGLSTFPVWWRALSAKEKVQSFYGTAKRIAHRRLWRRTAQETWRVDEAVPGSPRRDDAVRSRPES